MGFDESLLAQLARHQGTNRSLRFARAPNGYHHAGKWCVRMHEISGQEWPWLLELDGVQSKCVRHMHGVMRRNGFVALHPLEPPPKRSRAASQTHWFWKAGFSPDMDASLDTPPRRPVSSLSVQLAEARRDIQLERKRKQTLLRCLQSSEAKLRRLRDAHQCTLRELDNAKELIAISDEFRAAALSPVQVDDMLNV